MKKLSIAACFALATTTSVFAESGSIKEAISYGVASGDMTVYNKNVNNNSGADEGFTNGSLGIAFQTDSFHNVNAKVAFRANHEFAEKREGNYEDEFATDSLMTEFFLQYRDIGVRATLGRQLMDLEWIGDYNEAITIETKKLIDDIKVTLAYVDRQAESEEDESTEFSDVTQKGAYIADFNYEIEEDESEISAYYYNIPDVVDFYGIKAKGEFSMFEFTAHYAASSADKQSGEENSNILNLELEHETSNFEFAVGYIKTDKEASVEQMTTYGDNIDPTEELEDSIYAADSQTVYGKIEYEGSNYEVEAVYAQAKHGAADNKDKEFTVELEYAFTDALSAEVVYTTTSMQDSADDKDVTEVSLTYSF